MEHQEAYGVEKAFCVIVEYSGNLNEQHSYELDEKIATEILSKENIDADILYIEYYDDYDESIDYDIISFTFLPLSEIDSGSY